jgi:hypothetical protein
MKVLLKALGLIAAAVVAVPLVRYHTADPCRMLEKELVSRVQREASAARDSVREAAGRLAGESTQRATDQVAAAVQNVAVGVAAGLAKTKVENMSKRECVAEMWRYAVGGK